MLDAIYIAATGMSAEEMHVNVIANNLANVNTTAYKRSKVSFEDLMYRGVSSVRNENIHQGFGTAPTGTEKVFTEGDMKRTGEIFNVGIRGKGFFEVQLPDGSYAYTRSGEFKVDAERTLVNSNGYPLSTMIYIPTDTEEVIIESNGRVKVRAQGDKDYSEVGVIEISTFMNPNGLQPLGENMYIPSQQSGSAIYETPGSNSAGELAQGYVESSNVNLVDELTSLMTAQRAYGMNAKIAQTADEIMGMINNLKR